MRKLIVEDKFNNKKLSDFLYNQFPFMKQNAFYRALRQKDIKINGKRINNDLPLKTDDQIDVFISDEYLLANTAILNIVYEDDNILIINKPDGIEVTGNNSLTSLCENYIDGFVKPCHRLDRNTSGIVLFAKNNESLQVLKDKFKNNEIDKFYKATVYGILSKKQDRLEAYLFKDRKKSFVYISDIPKSGYRKIITNYNVISEDKENNISVLDIKLETGRTHQIRAHLAHIGHPIIGDR